MSVYREMHGAEEAAAACSYVRSVELKRTSSDVSCGFHLSRSKWDPYPWVNRVEEGSPADEAGVRAGDCILELNGEDIVGRRICELADLVRAARADEPLELLLWNAGVDSDCTPEALCCGPMPLNMQRLSACMTSVIACLECPVCLTTISPPACQCVNGHLLCIRCHAKSERCPVCRVKLSRGRCLLADQVFDSLVDSFGLNKKNNNQQMSDKIKQMFKQKSKWKDLPVIKVSQAKCLQNLLVDKALSAENLSGNGNGNSSGNGWRQAQAIRVARTYLDEPHLTTKSLSACDISASRLSSRCSSRTNLQEAGSTEALQRISSFLASPMYHCPYHPKCCIKILDTQLIDHFHQVHSEGPLIQYFTAEANFKLFDSHESTYYFLLNDKSFFLKILNLSNDSQTSLSNTGILIWMWFLGDSKVKHEYHLDLGIKLKDTNVCLINMSSTLFSLEKWSWQTIQKNQKGTFISMDTIRALVGDCNNNLNLEINIRHSLEC